MYQQDREAEWPIQICPTDFWQRCKGNSMKKRLPFPTNGTGELDILGERCGREEDGRRKEGRETTPKLYNIWKLTQNGPWT